MSFQGRCEVLLVFQKYYQEVENGEDKKEDSFMVLIGDITDLLNEIDAEQCPDLRANKVVAAARAAVALFAARPEAVKSPVWQLRGVVIRPGEIVSPGGHRVMFQHLQNV